VKAVRGLASLLVVSAIAGCSHAGQAEGTGRKLTLPELQYRLMDQVGRPLYCGPPVVHIPTPAQAQQEVTALRESDPDEFAAIVARLHLDSARLSAEDKLNILQQVETLRAITLQAQANAYGFDYVASRSTPEHVRGTIDSTGRIDLRQHDQVRFPGPGGCPV
jgi:hypothetical protein